MSTLIKFPIHQADDPHTREMSLATFAARAAYGQSKHHPTPNNHGVHVGDLFYDSWGYEQTNIDFYEVVALKGKCTAVLRQIANEYVGGHQMTGETRPRRGQYTGEPFQVRTGLTTWDSEPQPVCNSPRRNRSTMRKTTDDKLHTYSSYY